MNKQNKRRLDEVVERMEEGTAGIYFFQLERDAAGNELLACTTSNKRYSWAAVLRAGAALPRQHLHAAERADAAG